VITQQHVAIKSSLKELTALVDVYSETYDKSVALDDAAAMGALSLHQVKMTESVKQMQSVIYGPINMMTLHFEEVRIKPLIMVRLLTLLSFSGRALSELFWRWELWMLSP
jgi:hypothetical protein